MKCIICGKKSHAGKYCRSHKKACENIVRSYEQWRKALEISWKEYLSQIANNPLTGEWTKEVVQHLLKGGEQANVEHD